jgi:hypothetical protein
MNRPCHASCRSHEARQLRPLRGNGFGAWQGKATVSDFVSERSENLRKIVASNDEFTLSLQWVLLFYGHLIRVCRPCPSVVNFSHELLARKIGTGVLLVVAIGEGWPDRVDGGSQFSGTEQSAGHEKR